MDKRRGHAMAGYEDCMLSSDTASLLDGVITQQEGRARNRGPSRKPLSAQVFAAGTTAASGRVDRRSERNLATISTRTAVPERYLLSPRTSDEDTEVGTLSGKTAGEYEACSEISVLEEERLAVRHDAASQSQSPQLHTTALGAGNEYEDDHHSYDCDQPSIPGNMSNFSDISDSQPCVDDDRHGDGLHAASRHADTRAQEAHQSLWQLLEELTTLEQQLRKEAQRLREQKQALRERERRAAELEQLACHSHDQLAKCAELEVSQRWNKLEQERRSHTQNLLEMLKDRDSEVHRLEASFATMREANHALKQKVSKLELKNSGFSKQLSSSDRRLRNLQVRLRMQDRQQNSAEVVHNAMTTARKEVVNKSTRSTSSVASSTSQKGTGGTPPLDPANSQFERYVMPFCSLVEWIVDAQLMSSWKKIEHGPTKMTPEQFQVQCARLLPLVVELLTACDISMLANQVTIPCLRFSLMSSRFITHSNVSSALQSQRASLLMMFRHLGEAMTRSRKAGQVAMVASASWHVQLLSALFVLANVNRTDLVLHAFDILRNSLSNPVQKSTFLNHHGMTIVVMYMRSSTPQALVSAAVDVHLHMVNEPAILERFLAACSNDDWFHSVACILRDHKNNLLAEKLSIVLQRLAQGKQAHQYFVSHQLVAIAEQVIQRCGPESAFLVLNLRSMISLITAAVRDASTRQSKKR